jgi:membrane protease YdiL (CAAX protease family)
MNFARGLVRFAVVAVPFVAWAFVARGGIGLAAAILAAILVASLPALAVAQIGAVTAEDLDAMSIYLSSALLIAVLGTLSLVLGLVEIGAAGMSLGLPKAGALLLWSGVATMAGVLVLVVGRIVSGLAGWRETDLVRVLMPSNRAERAGFILVSMTAGIGEELTYRAFLLGLLTAAFGAPWTAAALTSIAFGLLHAYQGPLGMVRTGSIGFVLAAIVLATGSVWPVVVGHVMINLVAGLGLGEWLLDGED